MALKTKTSGDGKTWKKIEVVDVVEATYGWVEIPIYSTAALLCNRATEETLQKLIGIRIGDAASKAESKNQDPDALFLGSIHFIGDRPASRAAFDAKKWRYGIPCTAFKAALIRLLSLHDTASFAEGRALIYVEPNWRDLVEIRPSAPPHCDVRLGVIKTGMKSSVDPRWRAMFDDWSAKIRIRFSARHFSPKAIIEAFAHAGVSNGVGSMRPLGQNSTGELGTWAVDYDNVRACVPEVLTIEAEKAAARAAKKAPAKAKK